MSAVPDVATLWTYVQCPFHALTGLYCPLCGSTRAILALVGGHVVLALRCNLLAVAFVMWTAAVAARSVLSGGVGRGFSFGCRHRWRDWAAVMVVAIFTVARNLPGAWWLRP